MANKKYEIRYLPTFISQFNNILYYITYELKNKIAADNFYNEVIKQISKNNNVCIVAYDNQDWIRINCKLIDFQILYMSNAQSTIYNEDGDVISTEEF